ncbi:MAG: metallophosphoesterase family protein [Clostridia bacterium]|nr:metallophosphoesterase family protein [Clostridia bacterium]
MKLLILSDLHANLPALEAILREEGYYDRIYCAGDLVDYGTQPHEVIAWCREHNVQAVAGDHDRNVCKAYHDPDSVFPALSPEESAWSKDTCTKLTAEDIAWLSALPETLDFEADGYVYRMVHKFNYPCSYVCPRYRDGFDAFVKDVPRTDLPFRLILGHTHRQTVFTLIGERVWMNPGSTSFRQADDPDKSAQYAVIEDGKIFLRSVSYHRTPELAEILARAEVYLENKEANDIDC